MSEPKNQDIQMTPALQSLIASIVTAAVNEAKKPFISEEQLKEIESKKEDRLFMATQQLEILKQKKAHQAGCMHTRRDGSSRGVYVENGNFIICQGCQAIIRPDDQPELFSRLFQMTNDSGIFA